MMTEQDKFSCAPSETKKSSQQSVALHYTYRTVHGDEECRATEMYESCTNAFTNILHLEVQPPATNRSVLFTRTPVATSPAKSIWV